MEINKTEIIEKKSTENKNAKKTCIKANKTFHDTFGYNLMYTSVTSF